MTKFIYLGLAGAAGTLARYWVTEAAKGNVAGSIPWGTWAVNIVGCFLYGLIWVLAEERQLVSAQFRFFALAGFMGAFTTFSTYMFETVDLLRIGSVLPAVLNFAGQNVVGLLAVLGGMAIARNIS